jgi:hypothetical protein
MYNARIACHILMDKATHAPMVEITHDFNYLKKKKKKKKKNS